MEWYRQVQFVAAVPMPPEMADEFGTTVNGMWASPEFGDTDLVAELHRGGRRVLFSVPLIALVPRVYEEPGFEYLLGETCRDIAVGVRVRLVLLGASPSTRPASTATRSVATSWTAASTASTWAWTS